MRLRIMLVFILFISIIVLSVSGCYYDKEQFLYPAPATGGCSSISAKFSIDVAPIILTKCATAGCHNAASAAGATVLETYAQISSKAARINQRCIVDKTMPPGGGLSPSEIAILTCWISSGTPNN
jgi:uncharacterized membrane protein